MKKLINHINGLQAFHQKVENFDSKKEFKGKKVAVIGAADTIYNKENGKYIEEFDIIVRVNRAPHSWKASDEKFLGKRIDILYHSFFENDKSGGGKIDQKLFKNFGIRKIVNPNNNKIGRTAQLNFYKRHGSYLTTYLLSKDQSENIYDRFKGKLPTIGFYALASALLAETKELYISGFSFFRTGYVDGYRDDLNNAKANKKHIETQNLHDPDLEWFVFIEILKDSPSKKIILDDYLTNLIPPDLII